MASSVGAGITGASSRSPALQREGNRGEPDPRPGRCGRSPVSDRWRLRHPAGVGQGSRPRQEAGVDSLVRFRYTATSPYEHRADRGRFAPSLLARANHHGRPRTPFLDRLATESVTFRGRMPRSAGRFRRTSACSRACCPPSTAAISRISPMGARPDARGAAGARALSHGGDHPEPLFDGTLPGSRADSDEHARARRRRSGAGLGLLVAATKPRIRRLIRDSGFFHAMQRDNRAFIGILARMIVPADRQALGHALDRMASLRKAAHPYFCSSTSTTCMRPTRRRRRPRCARLAPSTAGSRTCSSRARRAARGARVPSRGVPVLPRVRHMCSALHEAIELMDAKLAASTPTRRGPGSSTTRC